MNKLLNLKEVQRLCTSLSKMPLIMRISLILLFVFAFQINAEHARSQSTKISLDMKNSSIEKVLQTIEEKSDYYFLYSNRLINVDRTVSVKVENAAISSVLDRLFTSHDVEYEVKGSQIILSPKEISETTTELLASKQQQGKTITGTIVDSNGESIIGANIIEKGTTNGTITDLDGNFTLEVNQNAVLRISYIGYLDQEVTTQDNNTFNIVLNEDTKTLDELVVVGFGVQKKLSITGSVSAISADEIVKSPVSNISNALAGRLPGVRVRSRGGIPGSEAEVDIRGFGTPLILVDGIEQPGFQVDPNEIESISVLKDASAAVYGVKAANGVLLITTKKGALGKARISYNGSVGFQNFTSYPNMVNAYEYAILVDEDAINHGNDPIYGPEKLELFREGTQPGYRNYDWMDILTRRNAPQTQHNVNVNGGSEDVKYFASLGYLDQQGIYSSGDINYSRYNFRSNVSAKIAEYLTADINLGGNIENHMAPFDSDDAIIHGITRIHPYFSPYANDEEGIHYGVTNYQNPLARSDADYSGYRKSKNKLLNASFSLKYDMPFMPGLSAKAMFSYLTKVRESKTFSKEFHLYSYDESEDQYNNAFIGNSPSSITRKFYTSEQNLLQFSLNYNRTFLEKHNVSGLFLYEQREDLDDYVEAYREFAIDALDEINAGMDKNKNNAGVASEMANVSFVGRVNYDYMSKYLFEFAFREDASAKFHKNNRWGFFPSISLGWRISEEPFIKNYTSIVDDLKIRASYGVIGDDNVASFQYLTGYNYPGGNNYIFGENVVNSVITKGLPNLNFSWLTAKIWNTGIDLTLWNHMLEVNLDLFYRKREGLIGYRSGSLPNTFGASFPQENLNSDDYRGFELVLGHNNRSGDWTYSVKGNMSFTRIMNRYIEQADPINSYTNWRNNRSDRWQNIEWGYKSLGLFQSQEEVNNWAVQDAAGNITLGPGDIKYEDFNGDGVINEYDMQPIGRNDVPEINFGVDLMASWKSFDFSLLMQGATNYTRWMEGAMGFPLTNGSSSLKEYLDRWHRSDIYDVNSEWIPGKYPSTYQSGKESNQRPSTFNTISSYYLRLKNVELGYTFPSEWMNKVDVNNLRLYISGNNILTFDNLPFGDPEAESRNRINYPQLRIWNIGVNLTF